MADRFYLLFKHSDATRARVHRRGGDTGSRATLENGKLRRCAAAVKRKKETLRVVFRVNASVEGNEMKTLIMTRHA